MDCLNAEFFQRPRRRILVVTKTVERLISATCLVCAESKTGDRKSILLFSQYCDLLDLIFARCRNGGGCAH